MDEAIDVMFCFLVPVESLQIYIFLVGIYASVAYAVLESLQAKTGVVTVITVSGINNFSNGPRHG